MPTAAFDFLARRRSHPAKFFDQTGPLPSRAELETILQAALRVPDHGKLEPWRLVVLSGKALAALGEIAVGLIFATVSGAYVVRLLLDYVSKRGYAVFGWWRIIVGGLALALLSFGS